MSTFVTALDQVSSLYVGYFGRAGDPNGENYWISQLNARTVTLASMASSFATQPEAMARYPYLTNPNISDPGAFVDQVFQNLFNHVADAPGKAYWVQQLQAAGGSASAIGAMILNVISGATGIDSTTITNKVDVAQDFTVKAANSGTTWNANAVSQSRAEITATNDTTASVTAAKSATDAYIATAPGPQSNFTLDIDTLTSGVQNANFNAGLIFNAPTGRLVRSLQSGDSATDTAPLTGPGLSNGGTFTATLNAAGIIPLVTLKGIPTHTVTQIAGIVTGYQGDITGLVTLNNLQSAGTIFVGAQGNGIDKGGVAGTTTTGATLLSTVNFSNVANGNTIVFVNAAALAGAADTLAINVLGRLGTGTAAATAAGVSVTNDTDAIGAVMNGYETVNLSASGTTNIALGGASTSGIHSTTTVNIAGAGFITLWGELGSSGEDRFTKVTTIDASTDTGGVTVTGAVAGDSTGFLNGNTVIASVKGGTGADSFDLSSTTAAQIQAITATNLDGGTGAARDTLILGSNAGGTGAANTVVSFNHSNFETIGISGLGGTVDTAKFGTGVDTFMLVSNQTAPAIFSNVATGLTFAFGSFSQTTNETFNSAGTALADVLNISHSDDGFGNLGVVTTSGFETINVTLTPTAAPSNPTIQNIIATASAGALVTLNLVDNSAAAYLILNLDVGAAGTVNVGGTGNGGVAFDNSITAGAINASASASAITFPGTPVGAISILGSPQDDSLRGSVAADSVSGGAGIDVIDPNAGGDVFSGGAGADTFGGVVDPDNFGVVGQGVGRTATTFATVAAGQTITFGSGVIGTSNVDRLTDFVSAVDKMDVANAEVAPTSLIGVNSAAAGSAGVAYVVYGTYTAATGVFTAATGYGGINADALVVQGDGATVLNSAANTGWVVLTGLNHALVAADFI